MAVGDQNHPLYSLTAALAANLLRPGQVAIAEIGIATCFNVSDQALRFGGTTLRTSEWDDRFDLVVKRHHRILVARTEHLDPLNDRLASVLDLLPLH